MSNPQYFVKFRKWNDHTRNSLISKKVRLSRVFDFNDFNEYSFSAAPYSLESWGEAPHSFIIWNHERAKLIFEQIAPLLCREDYQETLVSFVKETGFKRYICEKIENAVDQNTLTQLFEKEFYGELFGVFCGHYVHYCTLIFCVSDVSIFNTDASQLMFAHYADNCRGVALIYKNLQSDKIKKVNYRYRKKDPEKIPSRKLSTESKPDPEDFLDKSFSWGYEDEWRYVDYHGADREHRPCFLREKPLSELGLELVAVLHTARFEKSQKEYLEYIRTKYYEDKLTTQEIYADHAESCFRVCSPQDEKGLKVAEWINTIL